MNSRLLILNEIELILVHSGDFVMGDAEHSPELEDVGLERVFGRARAAKVTIPYSFYMGVTEVTVGQFRRFVDETGYKTESERGIGTPAEGWIVEEKTGNTDRAKFSWRNVGYPQSDDHPVTNVSWNDAKAYCNWLSKKTSRNARLPSEPEWEFACRAGTTTLTYFGNDLSKSGEYANLDQEICEWLGEGFSGAGSDRFLFASPVKSFKPNPLGLYDMIGNVDELCLARFEMDGDDFPITSPPKMEEDHGLTRLRGGSYWQGSGFASLGTSSHTSISASVGFRIVVDLE